MLPKKLCSIGSICGVRCNILTTSRSALPESHRPISSIRIAASAFSVLLTMSGSSELTPPIRFWAFSSRIALPPPLTTRTLNASVAADAPAAESARRLVAMLNGRPELSLRRAVAGELIGDHDTGWPHLPLQQLAQQPLGGALVAAALDQDVEHDPGLVHGSPQPVLY